MDPAPDPGLRRGPWVVSMGWHDLAFLHWPVTAADLRPAIPPPLELEEFDGTAWLGVVPFRMTRVRLRMVPPLPWLSAFPEVNLRTYVRHGGRSGVYFFSLDAHQKLGVRTARATFGLPYFDAEIRCGVGADGWIGYASRRTHRGVPRAEFRGRYRPTGPAAAPARGTLEHWLTERYSMFVVDRRGRVRRGDIWHAPWPLQPAECEVEHADMTRLAGVELPGVAPHVRFARELWARAWLPR